MSHGSSATAEHSSPGNRWSAPGTLAEPPGNKAPKKESKMKKKDKKSEEPEELESRGGKGIDMLRLDRKMAEILDAWREAKKLNPERWR